MEAEEFGDPRDFKPAPTNPVRGQRSPVARSSGAIVAGFFGGALVGGCIVAIAYLIRIQAMSRQAGTRERNLQVELDSAQQQAQERGRGLAQREAVVRTQLAEAQHALQMSKDECAGLRESLTKYEREVRTLASRLAESEAKVAEKRAGAPPAASPKRSLPPDLDTPPSSREIRFLEATPGGAKIEVELAWGRYRWRKTFEVKLQEEIGEDESIQQDGKGHVIPWSTHTILESVSEAWRRRTRPVIREVWRDDPNRPGKKVQVPEEVMESELVRSHMAVCVDERGARDTLGRPARMELWIEDEHDRFDRYSGQLAEWIQDAKWSRPTRDDIRSALTNLIIGDSRLLSADEWDRRHSEIQKRLDVDGIIDRASKLADYRPR